MNKYRPSHANIVEFLVLKLGELMFPDRKDDPGLADIVLESLGFAVPPKKPELARECPICHGATLCLLLHGHKFKPMGRFRTHWRCRDCRFEELSKLSTTQWLEKLGADYSLQTKLSLGIGIRPDQRQRILYIISSQFEKVFPHKGD